MSDQQEVERAARLYRQHNKPGRRCDCTRCRTFRAAHPRTAATEDATVHLAERVSQYKSGDLT